MSFKFIVTKSKPLFRIGKLNSVTNAPRKDKRLYFMRVTRDSNCNLLINLWSSNMVEIILNAV